MLLLLLMMVVVMLVGKTVAKVESCVAWDARASGSMKKPAKEKQEFEQQWRRTSIARFPYPWTTWQRAQMSLNNAGSARWPAAVNGERRALTGKRNPFLLKKNVPHHAVKKR